MNMQTPVLLIAATLAAWPLPGAQPWNTNSLRLVSSAPFAPICRSGAGGSFLPSFSADDRHVVFLSEARNLVTNDRPTLLPLLNVYVRDLTTGKLLLASVGTNGLGSGSDSAARPGISSNGTFVTFQSRAGDLVDTDANAKPDVFLRDVAGTATRLVSVNLSGQAGQYASQNPLISEDGRWVFFESSAGDLVTTPAGFLGVDIFARDLQSNTTFLLSVTTNGLGSAMDPLFEAHFAELCSITGDGRRAAFVSISARLVPGATARQAEVYVRDLQAGQTRWVSGGVAGFFGGASASYRCFNAVLSGDGSRVAFKVSDNSGTNVLLFGYDWEAQTTTLIASNLPTVPWPATSADGRFVAYEDGTNILVWDVQGQSNILASASLDGTTPGNDISRSPALTPDGRSVAFVSAATDLVTNLTAGRFQVYVRNLQAGTTRLASVNLNGRGANASHELTLPALSHDGRLVAFDSMAEDLVPDDRNQASDVFVRDLVAGTTQLISERDPGLPSLTGLALSSLASGTCISSNARWVAFSSLDGDLVAEDTNGWPDLFVRDLVTGTVQCAGFGTNASGDQVVSADGHFVAYTLRATNDPGSALGLGDVYRYDTQGGSVEPVSVNLAGTGAGLSGLPSISPDGRYVAFQSRAAGLVPLGAPDRDQVFVRDMHLQTNFLVSVSLASNYGNGRSSRPLFSPDGQWILFQSLANDLVPSCCAPAFPGAGAFYARNLASNLTILVSSLPNVAASAWARDAAFSPDSRWVVFVGGYNNQFTHGLYLRDLRLTSSNATKALSFDGDPSIRWPSQPTVSSEAAFVAYQLNTQSYPPFSQVFLLDCLTGVTNLISITPPGRNLWDYAARTPRVTPDGQFVVYARKARNVGAATGSETADILVQDRLQGVTLLVSATAAGATGNGPSTTPALGPDGRTVVFQSFASDLVTGSYHGQRNIFVLRLSTGDTDGDGMDDDWEMTYFETLDRDSSGDFDEDGMSDRDEFLAGTDPTNQGRVLRAMVLRPVPGGSTTVVWATAPGRTYQIQFKDNLDDKAWGIVPGAPDITAGTAFLVDPTSATNSYRFYRVVLQP